MGSLFYGYLLQQSESLHYIRAKNPPSQIRQKPAQSCHYFFLKLRMYMAKSTAGTILPTVFANYPVHIVWTHGIPHLPQWQRPFWKISLVTGGSGLHKIGRSSYELKAGDVFVINDKERESYGRIHDLQMANVLFDFHKLHVDRWQTRILPGFH